ncbi:MAG: transaldolase family protein [Sedimentisphaerales bacterium]|nr:transaldolase family protein [Sedimentisphaerales bacterium]
MTTSTKAQSQLSQKVHDFVRQDFAPAFGRRQEEFESNPLWGQFRDLGTELWLDSGNFDDVGEIWTREFSALTTNNTLLNREVQTGRYDDLILEAARLLSGFSELSDSEQLLELAFILNATHALRLVEKFDACVSVEEHTDLAHDVEAAVEYARRYYAICPERFYVKIPFTAAGLLATRQVRKEGIPVNHTLGFSARQNYMITRLAQPDFVNVFLGRLNSFVADNGLGSGDYVGEKATLASQRAVRALRDSQGVSTRQIGASFRSWHQYTSLAGIDVMTAPPNVAGQLLAQRDGLGEIRSRLDERYRPGIQAGVDPARVRLETLWDIDDELVACVDALEEEDLDAFSPQDLVNFFQAHGCGDFLIHWSDEQVATSRQEGKISKLENWADALEEGSIGLDSLMNLAGLNSFTSDQQAMDNRVCEVWKRAKS